MNVARISNAGYIERCTSGSRNKGTDGSIFRDWWLIKHGQYNNAAGVTLIVTIPKRYIGKKVRFKLEVMKE